MPYETMNDLEAAARVKLLDGIITGQPLGQTIRLISIMASEHGAAVAATTPMFAASVDYKNFDELVRESTARMVEHLFGRGYLAQGIQSICLAGAAFGFQQAKNPPKSMAEMLAHPESAHIDFVPPRMGDQ